MSGVARNIAEGRFRIGMVGFGNAGREFARILLERGDELGRQAGVRLLVTGIHTRTRGTVSDGEGIDLAAALEHLDETGRLPSAGEHAPETRDSVSFIRSCPADAIVEVTTLDVMSGEPATTHIETAFRVGMHVVTANKGPIAWHYRRLDALAREAGRRLLFESTVMDGAPVFNLVRRCLKGCSISGFTGILNSTTNFILDRVNAGESFDSALRRAQAMGIAEADPSLDIDGWDSAAKTAALMNVLMDAGVTPLDIRREGIRGVTRPRGPLRLVCRGGRQGGSVRLETVPEGHLFTTVAGTSSVLVLHTDLMGDLVIVENEPGVTQTAYGILSDILELTGN
ncbi:MAG: homoserine dehydrogenase [Firmicutes bacterium]|nr:homoserine dehydrogenase [Bacillota bacterium]